MEPLTEEQLAEVAGGFAFIVISALVNASPLAAGVGGAGSYSSVATGGVGATQSFGGYESYGA